MRENADVNIDVGLGRGPQAREREPGGKFRIALLGDFSGRGSRGLAPRPGLAGCKPISVDPGNFEDVMESLGVELHLASGSDPLVLRFSELDDFHPDHLYSSMALFKSLRAARAELAKAPPPAPAPTPPPPPPQPAAVKPSTGLSFLDQIADATPDAEPEPPPAPQPARKAAPQSTKDLFDEAIRAIGSRHAEPKADPRAGAIAAQMDVATSDAMRTVLGHPQFQALEAAWRSVFVLLQHVEVGEDLDICLLDISRAELAAESGDALARLLTGQDWSVIAGLYTFVPGERDCRLLARIGAIAAAAKAPFLSAIDPRVMGCASIAETPDPDDWDQPLDNASRAAWEALRSLPQAAWLGLALPRFLLRLPYGRKTSPVDAFDFEEMPDGPVHDGYLWGNPAVAAACLLAQAFQRNGWDMRPGEVNRLTSVPVHVFAEDEATPPAEVWITERLAERMLEEGVMPLASVKHSDAVQLVRFQALAKPARALAGPWK